MKMKFVQLVKIIICVMAFIGAMESPILIKIGLLIVLVYTNIDYINKSINRLLPKTKQEGYFQQLWINPKHAISKSEATKGFKILDIPKIGITYIPELDSYYIRDNQTFPRFIKRGELYLSLHNSVIAGDTSQEKESVELQITERRDKTTEYLPVLSVCLKHKQKLMSSSKDKFYILSELPCFYLYPHINLEELKLKGFTVNDFGGGDVFKNDYGEFEGVGENHFSIIKDGVEFWAF